MFKTSVLIKLKFKDSLWNIKLKYIWYIILVNRWKLPVKFECCMTRRMLVTQRKNRKVNCLLFGRTIIAVIIPVSFLNLMCCYGKMNRILYTIYCNIVIYDVKNMSNLILTNALDLKVERLLYWSMPNCHYI